MRKFIECGNSCNLEKGDIFMNKKWSKCKVLDVSENEQGCKEVTFQFNNGPVDCKKVPTLEKWLCDNDYELMTVNESARNRRSRVVESESVEELTLDDLADVIEDFSDYGLIAVPDYKENYIGIFYEDEEGIKHNLDVEFHLKKPASNGIPRATTATSVADGVSYLSVLDMNGFGMGRSFFRSKLKTLETFEDKVRFCLLDKFYMSGRQEINNWKNAQWGTWKFRLLNLDYVKYYVLEILEAIDRVNSESDDLKLKENTSRIKESKIEFNEREIISNILMAYPDRLPTREETCDFICDMYNLPKDKPTSRDFQDTADDVRVELGFYYDEQDEC